MLAGVDHKMTFYSISHGCLLNSDVIGLVARNSMRCIQAVGRHECTIYPHPLERIAILTVIKGVENAVENSS